MTTENQPESTMRDNVPPWMRPAEPDHPMMVEGDVTDGDTVLMLRCLIEEYLLGGHSPKDIRATFELSNYQAFHAAAQTLGLDRAEQILAETANRIGHHRVRFVETANTSHGATLTIGASAAQAAE